MTATARLRKMTRREFTMQIAYEYATFEANCLSRYGADQKIQPLEREFAFNAGRGYVESGRYRAKTDRAAIDPFWMDWGRVATEARKQLPYVRGLIADSPEEANR